ncbi:hypothetical protein L4Z68_001399 [Pseudomonas aeruginosa]|nr:hypothetical protein [Pseudomonas aeruginosa]EKX2969406.1 hypothetical protein [Pseudomonas aeruginosa]HDV6123085.1 hypothetical protein [Pseudomonas aeruginosa]HDV6143963.1 hypothetical protein [Pseudomonas aeruginosa]HDV6168264.1 hypothetical protein [Pseudomonas aeruginosa]
MTALLVVALVVVTLISLLLGFALFRLDAWIRADQETRYQPTMLRHTLERTLETARQQQDWSALEGLRFELKKALYTVDRLRHDAGDAALRATKPPRAGVSDSQVEGRD